MNELEPDAESSQWLWFGAALLAMMVIAYMRRASRDKAEVARKAAKGNEPCGS